MKRSGLSVAALVLGIVSCALCCNTYISVPCGILAIIFGAMKKSEDKMAKAGFVMGIVGVSIPVLIFVLRFLLGLFGILGFAGFITSLGV